MEREKDPFQEMFESMTVNLVHHRERIVKLSKQTRTLELVMVWLWSGLGAVFVIWYLIVPPTWWFMWFIPLAYIGIGFMRYRGFQRADKKWRDDKISLSREQQKLARLREQGWREEA